MKATKRMQGAGHPIDDPELEKILIKFMDQLTEEKQQFVTPLLVMKALFHRPNFKGGIDSPGFRGRVQNDIQSFIA